MKKQILIVLTFILLLVSCAQKRGDDLLDRIKDLPGVEAIEIAPPAGYGRAFEIRVTQLVNHANPLAGTFQQRIFLSHLDEVRPMVLETQGYGLSRNSIGELANLLQANQIRVTHRFFPEARPDPVRWQYLTIRQAADDHQRIVELFRRIYPGRWVNTGASKGGMSALYHRRFHADDVSATVAYVAPLIQGSEDPRFARFLFEQVGDEAGRQKIRDFQRRLLSERAALLPFVEAYARENNLTYPLGAEAAFEYAVLEYMFAFWQYGDGDVSRIPGPEAAPAELYAHLASVSGLYYYTDQGLFYFEPFFYQAFTELGYTPFFSEHLDDLLTAARDPDYRTFAPRGIALRFKPEVMRDVREWLQESGQRIIYIYGANDPWTAAAVEPSAANDALKVTQPGANHNVRISQLDRREEVIVALERWLDIDIDRGRLAYEAPDPRRELLFWLEDLLERPRFR
jgi:hypothetical protein